ncbi:methyltransferase domain-containing protein [Micromonospora sp. LOL_023]|uniref:glycosyltransferase family protein n=1 Tax=Micromonospora sp. LOL_023 TaxID=3345418 RepID=UPI003A8B7387
MSKYTYSFDPADTNNTAAAVYRLARGGGERVLDLGSGPGIVSGLLATAAGRTVTCADHDADALAEARAAGVPETVLLDLRDPQWTQELRGRRYDVVILADVLEHLVEPGLVLRALRDEKIIAADGMVVISFPNIAHESIILELSTGNFEYTQTGLLDSTHLRFFTRNSMQALLESTGYLLVETHRTLRTAEQTHHRSRAQEVDAELRRIVGKLGREADTYQYVMVARPSTEVARVAIAERRLNCEHAAHLSSLAEVGRLTRQLCDLQHRHQQLDEQLRRAQDAVGHERLDALQAREAQLHAEQERIEFQVKLKESQKNLKNLQTKLDTSQEQLIRLQAKLGRMTTSKTYRAGKAIRFLVRPAAGLRAVNRRRARSASRRTTGRTTADHPDNRRPGADETVPDHFRGLTADTALRASYEHAVRAEFGSGHPRIAFCVATTDLDAGRGDLYVAAGIGRQLKRHGYDVAYLPSERWAELPAPTDLAVAMIPTFDPLAVPDGCRVIAWVRNETERWMAHPHLALFDAVLASSTIALNRLRERYDGPTGLLPLGVDTELFTPAAVDQTRAGVVTTVNSWGRRRHLYQCLRDVDITFPFVIFGERRGLDPFFESYAGGSTSYFNLPDLYQRTLLVLDDLNHTTRPFGNINSRLLESLAAGALPVTNSRIGLPELGLGETPTYSDSASLGAVIRRLIDDPVGTDALARRLSAVVRDRHSYARRAEQLHKVLAELDPRPRRTATYLVGVFPHYVDNPYQDLLMSRLRSVGVQSYPVDDVVTGPVAPHAPAGRLDNYLLHVHWTDPILQPAGSDDEAAARLAQFKQRIAQLRQRGGRLIWTIHNVFPHECGFPEVERELARFLAAEADIVHVLSAETAAAVEAHYPLSMEKVRVVRHSSYLGVYPDALSRLAARRRFGFAADDHVLLFFGGVRPYKGVGELLDAFAVAADEDPRLRLIVAGPAKRLDPRDDLRERCARNPQITLVLDSIPDADIQLYFKAADTVVLPYRSVLNSGCFHLAISFGRAVVAPRTGSLVSLLDPRYTVGFDPEDDAGLSTAILAARGLRGRHVELAARAAARDYQVGDMARDYAELVTGLFETSPSVRLELVSSR